MKKKMTNIITNHNLNIRPRKENSMENQYKDLYDKHFNIRYAEARHIDRPGRTNPLITALPPKRSLKEIIKENTESPGLPPIEKFKLLSPEAQKEWLGQLINTRVYLPSYNRIEEVIDRALLQSYDHRISLLDERPTRNYIYKGKDNTTYQFTKINGFGNAPTGFSILGKSGCGKSTGVNNALRKYPKVIIHNLGTMQQYIQIPILNIEIPRNANFHNIYTAIGKRLDDILGNYLIYEKALSKKGENLGDKFTKLCHIIENFNVGLIIIDEIERISTRTKEDTLETFLSLSNETGVATGVIGTEESFKKLFSKPRTARRMGELINADRYCSSYTTIKNILETLYLYLPYRIELTEECANIYYKECDGNISYILQLFTNIALDVANQVELGKTPEITPKMIKKAANTYLTNMKLLNKNLQNTKIVEDEMYATETIRALMGSNKNENEKEDITNKKETDNLIKQVNTKNIIEIVKMAIHAFKGNEFTDKEIENAMIQVTKNNKNQDIQELITATYIEAQQKKENAEKHKKKKEQLEESLVDLKKFKESLPIANIDTL